MSSRPNPVPPPPGPATGWTRDVGTLCPDERLRGWLTEPGLLTERVRGRCQGHFGLRVLDERRAMLDSTEAAELEVVELAAFVREIELTCDDHAFVFAQTLVPVATLDAEPWLAALGREPLGPRLAGCGRALREPLEFARLTATTPLFARAWRDTDTLATSLWARRARYRLDGRCLVVQEVFLPRVLQ